MQKAMQERNPYSQVAVKGWDKIEGKKLSPLEAFQRLKKWRQARGLETNKKDERGMMERSAEFEQGVTGDGEGKEENCCNRF